MELKKKYSVTLSSGGSDPVREFAELKGLKSFSEAQEIINRFIGENYLLAAVAVYHDNGYEKIDGRYKDNK